jgi:hypothetical protein
VATGSNNNIKSNVEMELHGKSFLSPDFPYFQFFSDRSGKLISIDPNQDPPIKLSYEKDNGIELYYNGMIKLLKKDSEPLIISYQDLIDGNLGIQIQ